MGREKDQWSGLWGQVARDLRLKCGGRWSGVVDAIDTIDPEVLLSMFPGQRRTTDRKAALAKQMSNWGGRGTAPDKAVVPALSALLHDKLDAGTYVAEGNGAVFGAAEILKNRVRESGQGVAAPNGQAPSNAGEAIAQALLDGAYKDRDAAIQIFLERPETRFEGALEAKIGSILAVHAVNHGLTLEDSREWLSLAELLTVPFIRRWPTERLAGILCQLYRSAHDYGIDPGVVADRVMAAAALDVRLDEVLDHATAIIDSHRASMPIRVELVNALRDRADTHKNGTEFGRSFDRVATYTDV